MSNWRNYIHPEWSREDRSFHTDADRDEVARLTREFLDRGGKIETVPMGACNFREMTVDQRANRRRSENFPKMKIGRGE